MIEAAEAANRGGTLGVGVIVLVILLLISMRSK